MKDYDDLVALEKAAAETGLGLHNPDPLAAVASIRDMKVCTSLLFELFMFSMLCVSLEW